jgi:hypothetical protein
LIKNKKNYKKLLDILAHVCYSILARRETKGKHFDKRIRSPAVKSCLRNEVMPMTDYELLMITLTFLLVIVTAINKE